MLFLVFAIVTEPVLRYSTMVVERMGMILKKRIHKKFGLLVYLRTRKMEDTDR